MAGGSAITGSFPHSKYGSLREPHGQVSKHTKCCQPIKQHRMLALCKNSQESEFRGSETRKKKLPKDVI